MKLLIIEDERELSDNIVAYLSSESYVCEQAFTYAEARMKVNVYDYDCVLLDLMLPGGSGLDLLLFFIGNKNRVLSKAAIAEHLSGDMADLLDSHDFVYTHIKNLKAKLAEAGARDCVRNVYGAGYKWVEP